MAPRAKTTTEWSRAVEAEESSEMIRFYFVRRLSASTSDETRRYVYLMPVEYPFVPWCLKPSDFPFHVQPALQWFPVYLDRVLNMLYL
jgi:hypothetical protein